MFATLGHLPEALRGTLEHVAHELPPALRHVLDPILTPPANTQNRPGAATYVNADDRNRMVAITAPPDPTRGLRRGPELVAKARQAALLAGLPLQVSQRHPEIFRLCLSGNTHTRARGEAGLDYILRHADSRTFVREILAYRASLSTAQRDRFDRSLLRVIRNAGRSHDPKYGAIFTTFLSALQHEPTSSNVQGRPTSSLARQAMGAYQEGRQRPAAVQTASGRAVSSPNRSARRGRHGGGASRPTTRVPSGAPSVSRTQIVVSSSARPEVTVSPSVSVTPTVHVASVTPTPTLTLPTGFIGTLFSMSSTPIPMPTDTSGGTTRPEAPSVDVVAQRLTSSSFGQELIREVEALLVPADGLEGAVPVNDNGLRHQATHLLAQAFVRIYPQLFVQTPSGSQLAMFPRSIQVVIRPVSSAHPEPRLEVRVMGRPHVVQTVTSGDSTRVGSARVPHAISTHLDMTEAVDGSESPEDLELVGRNPQVPQPYATAIFMGVPSPSETRPLPERTMVVTIPLTIPLTRGSVGERYVGPSPVRSENAHADRMVASTSSEGSSSHRDGDTDDQQHGHDRGQGQGQSEHEYPEVEYGDQVFTA